MQNSLHKILLGLMQIAESGAFEGIIYSVISFLNKQTNCKIIIFISFFALKIDSVEIFTIFAIHTIYIFKMCK